MIYTDLTKKAMKLCFDVHKDQIDKSGLPYVFHPFHLAEQMDDEISTVCALLHDVIEDSDLTFEFLERLEFPSNVLKVLSMLTHNKEVPYMEYIKNIATDPIATKVKIADLRHNSDLSRLNVVTEKDIQRNSKYQQALRLLMNT